jgi:DNA-binding protein H-NS
LVFGESARERIGQWQKAASEKVVPMHEEAGRLREQAKRCRRAAQAHHDQRIAQQYEELARHYEVAAAALEDGRTGAPGGSDDGKFKPV